MINIRFTRITPLDSLKTENLIDSLSPSARDRLASKKDGISRLCSLSAYALLNAEERADLRFSEGGVPYFERLDKRISISHSEHFAAIAVSESKEEQVGIDIEEHILTEEKQNRLAERFFTENENKAYREGAPFYEIWTKKEALLKYQSRDGIFLLDFDTVTAHCLFETAVTDEYTISVCKKK